MEGESNDVGKKIGRTRLLEVLTEAIAMFHYAKHVWNASINALSDSQIYQKPWK